MTNLLKFAKILSISSKNIPKTVRIMSENCSTKARPRFEPHFYTGAGASLNDSEFYENVSSFVQDVKKSGSKGVLFLGENHQDPTAHTLELKILEKVFQKVVDANLKFGISLEFFDRESQPLLNEYLSGIFDYSTFLTELGSKAANNHEDYKPLLEFGKSSGIPIVASNCPRKYSKLVARHGAQILETLPKTSSSFLPPLPYKKASERYIQNFLQTMQVFGNELHLTEKMSRILEAQTLWDATMAFSIQETLESNRVDVLAHVTGYFHVKENLGIREHFDADLPIRFKSVIILPEDEPNFVATDHENFADFIILTDSNNIE